MYRVKFVEIVKYDIDVEADNADEAYEKAFDLYCDGYPNSDVDTECLGVDWLPESEDDNKNQVSKLIPVAEEELESILMSNMEVKL